MKKVLWFAALVVAACACVALDFFWFNSQGYTGGVDIDNLAHDAMARQLIFGNYLMAGMVCLAVGLLVACIIQSKRTAKRKVRVTVTLKPAPPPLDVARYAAAMAAAARRRRVRQRRAFDWQKTAPWALGVLLLLMLPINVTPLVHWVWPPESAIEVVVHQEPSAPPVVQAPSTPAEPAASIHILSTCCWPEPCQQPWWKELENQLSPFAMGSFALTMLGLMAGLFVWAFRQGKSSSGRFKTQPSPHPA